MPLELCRKCGFMHYITDPCRTRVALAAREVGKSAAQNNATERALDAGVTVIAKDEARGVGVAKDITPKRGRGRPTIHPDRKAYKAQKERERRARLKGQSDQR